MLISDSLSGIVDDDEQDVIDYDKSGLYAVIEVSNGRSTTVITGPVRSFLLDDKPEIELKTTLDDGLLVASQKDKALVSKAYVQKGDTFINIAKACKLSAVRVDEIDIVSQLCLLSVQLLPNS